MSRRVQIGDVCKFGHSITGENVAHRKYRGKEVVRCARCLADTAKRYNSTEKGRKANAEKQRKRQRTPEYNEWRRQYVRLYRARKAEEIAAPLTEADVAKYDDKKTAVQRILGIKPEAMPAHEAMSEWFDSNRSPCFEQPELYSDYDDPRYPEDAIGVPMPSTGQAEALCADCPLKTLCLEFALKNREDSGIWGGKRIVAGRIYQGGSGRVKKEEK